tara:strand:+ start:841 stop:1602 length:762 start_codon:yes stop_codon:yes gene_type:complete
MIIAIMQPTFIPWIGYFDMIDKVDSFIFLDHVQLSKRSWQVRNKIKFNDQEKLISIPIKKEKNRDSTYILDAQIDYSGSWDTKFLDLLKSEYNNSEFYQEVSEIIIKVLQQKPKYLSDLNINLITKISLNIGVESKFIRSSELKPSGKKDKMLVDILKKFNCNKYLSAPGSYSYIERNNPGGEFSRNNIDLFYHVYNHPQYTQLGGNFISHLSILDLLFNLGFKKSLSTIIKGRNRNIHFKEFKNLKLNLNER